MDIRVMDVPATPAAVLTFKATMDNMSREMGKAFGHVAGYMSRRGIQPAGMPFALYHSMEPGAGGEWEVIAGFPVPEPILGEDMVEPYTVGGCKAVTATHMGSYDTLEQTYHMAIAWAGQHKLKPAGAMWEYYFTDPNQEPDQSKWRTDVYVAVEDA